MIEVTAQQRANAIEALNVMWPSIPKKNVVPNLQIWRRGLGGSRQDAPDCGTVACFGGWCAWWPSFRDQGVYPDYEGAPRSGSQAWAADVSKQLFGHPNMFSAEGGHEADYQFNGDSHALVTNRLKSLIENSEVTP